MVEPSRNAELASNAVFSESAWSLISTNASDAARGKKYTNPRHAPPINRASETPPNGFVDSGSKPHCFITDKTTIQRRPPMAPATQVSRNCQAMSSFVGTIRHSNAIAPTRVTKAPTEKTCPASRGSIGAHHSRCWVTLTRKRSISLCEQLSRLVHQQHGRSIRGLCCLVPLPPRMRCSTRHEMSPSPASTRRFRQR